MNVVTVPAAGEKQEQFLLAQRIPMTRPWPLAECNLFQRHCRYYTPITHLAPWPFRRNQTQEETEGPAGGKEMNDPRQWDVTNSPSGRDKSPDCDLFPNSSLSFPALSSQVCTSIFNKSLSLSCICLTLELVLAGTQEPSHRCSELILSWTALWASSNVITYKELQLSL